MTVSSSNSSNGSKFDRTVPLNRTGSCGMIEIAERTRASGSETKSTPSMAMVPARGSTMRNSAWKKVLFPVMDLQSNTRE